MSWAIKATISQEISVLPHVSTCPAQLQGVSFNLFFKTVYMNCEAASHFQTWCGPFGILSLAAK